MDQQILLKTKELEDLKKQLDVYKAKMESLLISQLDENNMKKVTLICKYKNSFVFNTVMTELSALDDVIKIRMNSDLDIS